MKIPPHFLRSSLLLMLVCAACAFPQSSTGSIQGTVTDQNGAVVTGASVTARNTATGFTRTISTNADGRYHFQNVPTGTYEVIFEAANFSRLNRTGITLNVGQNATADAALSAKDIRAEVTIEQNTSLLDTTTAQISTGFGNRRMSELPVASNRSSYNVLLSAPGVSQLVSGQTTFALGISFSANGGRIRSNVFMIDGQDINDPALTGAQIPLNNPDAIQEVQIITNQFLPEYGGGSGSVANFIGRSGTNNFQGSLFWFQNSERLNACSNTDKQAGFCDRSSADAAKQDAPLRRENQVGFTIGGPVVLPRFGDGGPKFYSGKHKSFFFVDYQRWSDKRSPSLTLKGAPTAAGRNALLNVAAGRPQVEALLRLVPAGVPDPSLSPAVVTMPNGQRFDVELGDLTATSSFRFRSDQGSFRIDHQFNKNNLVYARHRFSYESTTGSGQIAPPGHAAFADLNTNATAIVWISSISPAVSNEARIAWKRYDLIRDGEKPLAKNIPAIQVGQLGMTGGPESDRRTAFGLAPNLPVIRTNDTYEIAESFSVSKGKHSLKFGFELKRNDEKDNLFSPSRGTLVYDGLSQLVNDIAQSANRTLPLPGGDLIQYYRWHELFVYGQDQWQIRPDLNISFGARYEYPGDSFSYLRDLNARILAANDNNPAFAFEPIPRTDINNWMPRIGFNWNPRTNKEGLVGLVTGGGKLVIRAGYARAYDMQFINTHQNIFNSFPFTAANTFRNLSRAFERVTGLTSLDLSDLTRFNRGAVAEDFRAPATDQFSVDIQRELSADLIFRIGYVHNRGTGLFQIVEGNPRLPCLFGTGTGTCNTTLIDRITGADIPPSLPTPRVDSTKGPLMLRTNAASSVYDAMQASLEKRLSRGISFALHYTWSSTFDTTSDITPVSPGESAVQQDPFNSSAEWARSAFDRPQRLSGNIVYELPFFTKQKGFTGRLFGGWQVNSFFNFQTGAPFSVLNGSDPTGTSSAGMRPNLFTDLEVSRMSVSALYRLNRQMIDTAMARAREIFNSLPQPVACNPASWLPGPPLPYTLFSAPRGRIVCNRIGQPDVEVVFTGILEGQRVGTAGRNILRSDSYNNVDIGLIKNTKIGEQIRAQIWFDLFDAFNSRNFGVPSGTANSPTFLDKWATDGGARRIRLGARLVF